MPVENNVPYIFMTIDIPLTSEIPQQTDNAKLS